MAAHICWAQPIPHRSTSTVALDPRRDSLPTDAPPTLSHTLHPPAGRQQPRSAATAAPGPAYFGRLGGRNSTCYLSYLIRAHSLIRCLELERAAPRAAAAQCDRGACKAGCGAWPPAPARRRHSGTPFHPASVNRHACACVTHLSRHDANRHPAVNSCLLVTSPVTVKKKPGCVACNQPCSVQSLPGRLLRIS